MTYEVVQIDADSNPAAVVRCGALSMPTPLVFQGGEPVKQMAGARAERRLLQELEDVIGATGVTA